MWMDGIILEMEITTDGASAMRFGTFFEVSVDVEGNVQILGRDLFIIKMTPIDWDNFTECVSRLIKLREDA